MAWSAQPFAIASSVSIQFTATAPYSQIISGLTSTGRFTDFLPGAGAYGRARPDQTKMVGAARNRPVVAVMLAQQHKLNSRLFSHPRTVQTLGSAFDLCSRALLDPQRYRWPAAHRLVVDIAGCSVQTAVANPAILRTSSCTAYRLLAESNPIVPAIVRFTKAPAMTGDRRGLTNRAPAWKTIQRSYPGSQLSSVSRGEITRTRLE
jgi:hypothetical protein